MFWAGLVLFVLGIGCAIGGRIASKYPDVDKNNALLFSKWSARTGTTLFLIFFVLAVLITIPVGTVGVQTVFGKIQARVLHEGLSLKNPLAAVTKMSVQTQTYTMSITTDEGQKQHPDSIKVLSKDNLEVDMDLSVLFALQPADAQQIYQVLGSTDIYMEKLVRPSIRTAIRDVSSRYIAADLMSSARTQAEKDIQVALDQIFREYFKGKNIAVGIICERVLLRNVQPPATLKAAIEDKLSKQQQRDAMQFVLETEKAKAEQKVIEAHGLADSQAIINKTLTPEYLQWKYIETLGGLVNSPNNTIVVLPFDQKLTPMIQIPGHTK